MPHLNDFLPDLEEFVPSEELYLKIYKLLLRSTLLGEALDERKEEFAPLKIFTGLGQEAIGVGTILAAESYDLIAPDHRVQQSMLIGRGFPEKKIICQAGAFAESIYGGYDFGIHIGTSELNFIRFVSDMGLNTAVGAGAINGVYYFRDFLNEKNLFGKNPVLIAIFGEGAMSHGNMHSAFKFATVYKLPVLFILNNNGREIRTDKRYQNPLPLFSPVAAGFGMPFNVLNPATDPVLMWRAAKHALKHIRKHGGPYFLECVTERVSGHNAHETMMMSGYVPKGLRKEWLAREPLLHYTAQLRHQGILNEEKEKEFKKEAANNITEAFEAMKTYTAPSKLHAPFAEAKQLPPIPDFKNRASRIISYGDAITEALAQGMRIFKNMRIFGEDVESGGVHGRTKKLVDEFERQRVFHTPLDENGICAFAIGQALAGILPCFEVQFLPFSKYLLGPLLTYAGTHYPITGQSLAMVVRAPFGGGFASNHCHQEMIEALIAHAGGVKIVCPATPYAAKGLLLSALNDGNPVIFLEQILHYTHEGEVPEEPYFLPFGDAKLRKIGKDLSIITYGAMMVARSLEAAEILEKEGISAQVLDLQTIVPMDTDAIISAATKTKKVLIVHEAKTRFGVGAEIARIVSEYASNVSKITPELENFSIKTKVLGAKDGPVASHPALEKLRLPQVEDIVTEAKEIIS